jgi:sulfide dehydrogenase [flavocytochrome c] flavoprotein subunit
MEKISRRRFIELMGNAGAISALQALTWPLTGCGESDKPPPVTTQAEPQLDSKAAPGGKPAARAVIVGGGFGGATCAKYLRRFSPDVSITLIERDARFMTCPFSNTVLSGLNDIDYIGHGYKQLKARYAVNVVQDTVMDIDPVVRHISLQGGDRVAYDALVVSPGIDFRWDAIEGYDAASAELLPHAWQAGHQTQILRRQLEAMHDGGLVIVAPPDNPFRCPPGPYERVSLIAHYLKTHKPKSKILVLDAKDKFSKQALFMQGWDALYPGMIEWVKGSDWGGIGRVEADARAIYSSFDKGYKADVINLIPPQEAGAIAHRAGLVNSDGWCPVNQRTFESSIHPDVYVIGDASVAGQMPKSGFAANSQGKVCAAALTAKFKGIEMPDPSYVNTCYSLVAPDYGISVVAVSLKKKGEIKKVEGAGGVSPADVDPSFRAAEARYAVGWYQSITSDAFG